MLKVYDTVWVMVNNKPVRKQIFAIVESMDYGKQGTEFYYHIVNSTIGAGWGNDSGDRFSFDKVFASKRELLDSL